MVCAKRRVLYAVCIGLCVVSPSVRTFAKEDKESSTELNTATAGVFHWNDHSKLSWDDFIGPVHASDEESAAATHCGIGFKVVNNTAANPAVIVFNTFYPGKSWVRADAKIPSILEHEQGHFDLCELYTRKLRERMCNVDLHSADARTLLMKVYSSVSREYEAAQQSYEQETIHGTNLPEQKRWQAYLADKLSGQGTSNPLASNTTQQGK